jgi:ribosomal protein S27AE
VIRLSCNSCGLIFFEREHVDAETKLTWSHQCPRCGEKDAELVKTR